MISKNKIIQKIIQLDQYLSILDEISMTSESAFLADKILIGSAKYYLQVSIESCLDIANHIVAAQHYRVPENYADTFTVLEENNLMAPHLADKLRRMAKFRNRLVHLYGEIDNKLVYTFMQKEVEDIRAFRKSIIRHYGLMLPRQ